MLISTKRIDNFSESISARNDTRYFLTSTRESNIETQRIHVEMANLKVLNQKILDRLVSLESQNSSQQVLIDKNPLLGKRQDNALVKTKLSE